LECGHASQTQAIEIACRFDFSKSGDCCKASQPFETLMWSTASGNPAIGIDAAAICKARGFTMSRALEIDFTTLRISRVGIG
jgi:hypothetical protein